MRLKFRSEFFNFTNTPVFGAPVTNIEAATVGRILPGGRVEFLNCLALHQ